MIRVLLVDDEEDALDLLEILLERIGGVEVAGRYNNPDEAVEEMNRLSVDAVFLDNQMPGMKGTDVARAIRTISPQIPIVFTTAYAEYAVEAFEIQSTDYLLKPITPNRLRDAIERIKQTLSAYSLESLRSAETRFVIQSLGGFHVRSPETGHSMPWRTKKERELCAFLVHHEGKPASAASIIEALWPGYELDKAKTYLYTCLSYLRKSLSDQGIPIRILKNDQGFIASYGERTVDATEFERLLRIAIAEEEADERWFIRFESMYKGEYMEACDFAWADARQMGIKSLYIRALRSRYARLRIRGEAVLAADSLQRILSLAPDSEADGRELIELYLKAGNRNEALRVYQRLEQAVRVQLGTELEEETIQLLQPAQAREDRKGRMLR